MKLFYDIKTSIREVRGNIGMCNNLFLPDFLITDVLKYRIHTVYCMHQS